MRNVNGSFQKRWNIQKEIGRGGQGTVYLVDELQSDPGEYLGVFARGLWDVNNASLQEQRTAGSVNAIDSLKQLIDYFGSTSKGALKILSLSGTSPNPDKAKTRARREIQVLSEDIHPNLLKLIDFDDKELWYVSKYYREGTLDGHRKNYKGQLCKVLLAVRPLVEAVAVLHQQSVVHRDIKPQNIFIGDEYELVLGDFGLVYIEDSEEARVTSTGENVGSWDWMPPWATDKRVEDQRPSFDVFSLAKVIWSLVSGKPFMRYWNFSEDGNNVEKLCLDAPNMDLANELFSKCIVEKESDCLKDAGQLLKVIDDLLLQIARCDPLAVASSSKCQFCSSGNYTDKAKAIAEATDYRVQFIACDICGHLAAFANHDRIAAASENFSDSGDLKLSSYFMQVNQRLFDWIANFNRVCEYKIMTGTYYLSMTLEHKENMLGVLRRIMIEGVDLGLPPDVLEFLENAANRVESGMDAYALKGIEGGQPLPLLRYVDDARHRLRILASITATVE